MHEFLLSDKALDTLLPMHVIVGFDGVIAHVGPTLERLCEGEVFCGRQFKTAFEILRPREVSSVFDLLDLPSRTLSFRLNNSKRNRLRGAAVTIRDGMLLNFSFGTTLSNAVAEHDLTLTDFAPADPAIEMLYLIEANSSTAHLSKHLSERLQAAHAAAQVQALTDTLTGLDNRRALDQAMDHRIARREVFACMQFDLDYFKSVNDAFGHAAGSYVLQVVAQILKAEFRQQDTIARLGGDEFVILIHKLDDPETLGGIARRIIERLEQPIPFEENLCLISASAGTSVWSPESRLNAETLLRRADLALYASKYGGRAQHRMFDAKMLQFGMSVDPIDQRPSRPDTKL